jgi:hypothetical protein
VVASAAVSIRSSTPHKSLPKPLVPRSSWQNRSAVALTWLPSVTYPLRRLYGRDFTISPLSVLVDPRLD